MKSLSLNKPLIILVVGIPGSGKSFFARQFAGTFKAPLINLDQIASIVAGKATTDQADISKAEGIVDVHIDELSKTKKTVVVDGIGSSKAQRMQIRKKALGLGYDTLLVWVQTDVATSKYRSMQRTRRRKDDLYTPAISGDEFDKQLQKFTKPAVSENYVVISGKHTYGSQAKAVLKKIVSQSVSKKITNHPGRKPNAREPQKRMLIR